MGEPQRSAEEIARADAALERSLKAVPMSDIMDVVEPALSDDAAHLNTMSQEALLASYRDSTGQWGSSPEARDAERIYLARGNVTRLLYLANPVPAGVAIEPDQVFINGWMAKLAAQAVVLVAAAYAAKAVPPGPAAAAPSRAVPVESSGEALSDAVSEAAAAGSLAESGASAGAAPPAPAAPAVEGADAPTVPAQTTHGVPESASFTRPLPKEQMVSPWLQDIEVAAAWIAGYVKAAAEAGGHDVEKLLAAVKARL